MDFFVKGIDLKNFMPGFEMEAGFVEPLSTLPSGEMIIIDEYADSEFAHSDFFFAGFAGGPA